jgi:hypothetical protein
MLTASLATHPLEMFPLLCFAAGLALAIVAALDPAGARKPAMVLILSLAVATGTYLSILSRAVPDLSAYGADDKRELWARLDALGAEPLTAIVGESDGRDLLTRTLPGTTVTVFGIPALALVALRVPASAAILALGIVPLGLLYASRAGFIALSLATASSVVKDVNAYFGLLGLLSLAIGLSALIQAALHAAAWRPAGVRRVITHSAIGTIVVWLAWKGGPAGRPVVRRIERSSSLSSCCSSPLRSQVAVNRHRQDAPHSAAHSCVPPDTHHRPDGPPGRSAGSSRVGVRGSVHEPAPRDAAEPVSGRPRVSICPRLAGLLREGRSDSRSRPPIPVPEGVVEELRKRIPPRSVVLADPRYSCALVVLFSGYCINPEKVYNGLYFRTAERYHAEYVRVGDRGIPEHPFFNTNPTLTAGEARLLTDYRVSYLLTDPDSTNQTAGKLTQLGSATLEMERDGYRLYRISGS